MQEHTLLDRWGSPMSRPWHTSNAPMLAQGKRMKVCAPIAEAFRGGHRCGNPVEPSNRRGLMAEGRPILGIDRLHAFALREKPLLAWMAEARVARRGPGDLVFRIRRHQAEEDAGVVRARRKPPLVLLCGHLALLDGNEEEG